MKWKGFLTCHCEGSVRSNPLNILEEIASEKTLAMTDRVILLQLMICSVSSVGYYSLMLMPLTPPKREIKKSPLGRGLRSG
ncbi:MAG: hypothetical protein JETT_3023 [Candidatus Jettenia ecosi]|uniref:Uncharacterized protein n=1 Tax=Candidatus Jettenia ecosi TaxID=2494326 RepID=A0A533QJJ4_9BACT|nr:MAG: hypothetical protein JETT_3023 [Candidatus Jettenia ecosi]